MNAIDLCIFCFASRQDIERAESNYATNSSRATEITDQITYLHPLEPRAARTMKWLFDRCKDQIEAEHKASKPMCSYDCKHEFPEKKIEKPVKVKQASPDICSNCGLHKKNPKFNNNDFCKHEGMQQNEKAKEG